MEGKASGTEAGSYLRPIDSCITQLEGQGPSRTCNESKEERREGGGSGGSRGSQVHLAGGCSRQHRFARARS